jgi:hypothetical protein
MKVLVIGSGGREHAIAWKLLQSSRVQTVYVAPGNGGTALDGRLHNLPLTDFNELAEFAVSEKIALTVVGPEGPLAAGIVDFFRARGLRIFGPTKAAAQLESSKAHAKAVMARPSSSRPMDWPPARAWWWRPRWRRRTRRSTGCWAPTVHPTSSACSTTPAPTGKRCRAW